MNAMWESIRHGVVLLMALAVADDHLHADELVQVDRVHTPVASFHAIT